MFSKLRKLVSKDDDGQKGHGDSVSYSTRNMPTLGPQLQMRFGKGVNYNMKIVIRGDRNVGKTCLLLRLQGHPFKEEYIPSDEIQVAHIQWGYRTTDDIVKVEVWDVVDKSKKRKVLSGLKIQNGEAGKQTDALSTELEVGLDAETLDVYKGAHGVIMMLDMTKNWTFDYVKREMENVPFHLPVLIMVNHIDMAHHQVQGSINRDMVATFFRHLDRPENASPILVSESSMRNGFGLKYLEGLELQLQQNRQDTQSTFLELESLQESEEQNYELFSANLGNRRRAAAEKLAPNPNLRKEVPARDSAYIDNSESIQKNARRPFVPPVSSNLPQPQTQSPALTLDSTVNEKKSGFFSFSSNDSERSVKQDSKQDSQSSVISISKPTPVKNIDEFIPDEDISGDFLEEPMVYENKRQHVKVCPNTSDEEDNGNPMVANYQDEIEIEDIISIPLANSIFHASDPVIDKQKSPDEIPESTDSNVYDDLHQPEVVCQQSYTENKLEVAIPKISPDSEIVAESVPVTKVAFSADELSSWLETVERRTSEVSVLSQPQDLSSQNNEEVMKAKKEKPKKIKKKVRSVKKEDFPQKATTDSGQIKSPRKPTEKDEQAILERELEDFLADDN